MASTKKGGAVIIKFWAILEMALHGVLGGEIFLTLLVSTIPEKKLIISFFLQLLYCSFETYFLVSL